MNVTVTERWFRREAIAEQVGHQYGDVAVAVPLSWHVVGYFIAAAVSAIGVFLSLATYSRVETVPGMIVPAAGITPILPLRSGVITALSVKDGQEVRAGAPLAVIRAEEDSASGIPAGARIEGAIAQQDASLGAQIGAIQAATQAQLRQLSAQQTGALVEAAQIAAQLDLQKDLTASAQRDLDRARALAERGFVSLHDLDQRRETLLTRQQGLSQLTQAVAAKRTLIAEAERSAGQITAQARAAVAGLAAARAQVKQQAASIAGTRAYVLRAPVAGKVTALIARVGQPAGTQTPLITILPRGSELRAELDVGSAAIGFVKPGQRVSLAIDAFPYQRFGTVTGKIRTVAVSAISRAEGARTSATSPVYPVTVGLDHASVPAYGRQEPLIAGMTLTARIVTERQSLLAWLFDPVLAVDRR